MESVGIRHFKENLSRYLRQVRQGNSIIISDRKKQIAIIQPITGEKKDDAARLMDLVRDEKVCWNGKKPEGLSSLQTNKGQSVADAVIEDRR